METEFSKATHEHIYLSAQKSHRRAKLTAGTLIIAFGVLFLLKELGMHIPHWVFSTGTILMAIGLVILAKHKFKTVAGYLFIIIGKFLLLSELYPDVVKMNVIWPLIVIIIGLSILLSPKRRFSRDHHRFNHWRQHHAPQDCAPPTPDLLNVSQDDFIDAVSIFGGVQKNVVSKQFRGADIVTIFGGNEINLSQADFSEQIVMDVTNIFGGTTLTVPNNWEIKSEVITIFGGIEDKRPVRPQENEASPKVVLLKGTCMFGGIEINSFN